MLILDKARTLDLMIAHAECVRIPEHYALLDVAPARGPVVCPSLLKGPPLPFAAAPLEAAPRAYAPAAEVPFAWHGTLFQRHTAQRSVA
jgi:hypothetical protein